MSKEIQKHKMRQSKVYHKRIRYFAKTIYPVLFLGFFLLGCNPKSPQKSPIIPSVIIPTDILQEGDLVFRRGNGLESELVVALDKVGIYSHIGIVVKDTFAGWQVVHIVPGEQELAEEPDRIKMEDISLFFREDRANCGAIMRLNGNTQKCKSASLRAQQLYHQKILFDHTYNIKDTTQMYCTELIDFVFRKENIFLYKEIIDKKYLLPGDIQVNEKLEVIFRF